MLRALFLLAAVVGCVAAHKCVHDQLADRFVVDVVAPQVYEHIPEQGCVVEAVGPTLCVVFRCPNNCPL